MASLYLAKRHVRRACHWLVLLLLWRQHAAFPLTPTSCQSARPTHHHRHVRRIRVDRRECRTTLYNAETTPETNPDDKLDIRILLVDHYDSFTYNLADLLAQICRHPPLVRAADADDLADCLTQVDGLVLSPGPGHPADCRVSQDLVRQHPDLPILGVCLGHQILGLVYNATIDLAPTPIHGQVQTITVLDHQTPLWQSLPSQVNVTRYHSLQVTHLPADQLTATSFSEHDGVVMSLQHAVHPHYGVQFHPESIGSASSGPTLLRNFGHVCLEHKQATTVVPAMTSKLVPPSSLASHEPPYSVLVYPVDTPKDAMGQNLLQPESVVELFLSEEPYSFWLDQAVSGAGTSILGASKDRVEYWGREHRSIPTVYEWRDDKVTELANVDILSYLADQQPAPQDSFQLVHRQEDGSLHMGDTTTESESALPFDYRGGHVGYLGYEVRHDTELYLERLEHGHHHDDNPVVQGHADDRVPTAAMLWATKSYVMDHATQQWYLLALSTPRDMHETLEWIDQTSKAMRQYEHPGSIEKAQRRRKMTFVPNRSKEAYNRNFADCLEHIRQGNSYELCLTNQLEASVQVPGSKPLDLYKILRKRNPAPHSAFFHWGGQERNDVTGSGLAICCSSPERFLSVKQTGSDNTEERRWMVEAKPIKGTSARVSPRNGFHRTQAEMEEDARRAIELQLSEKNRAENLMIVDLLRNDMSRACESGSVHVAKLMNIESFATVHQMVSTIRGMLNSSPVDVLRCCFPGGSMTGAPKLSSVEILHGLEDEVCRGPYSGSLGYISTNGSMDMNIIIRTALLLPEDVADCWKVSVGAGGAITALSESEDEYQEMLLKSAPVTRAVEEWVGSHGLPLKVKSQMRKSKKAPIESYKVANATLAR